MNILFLTIGNMESIEQHALYPDLLRFFRDEGHNVYTVSTYERRCHKETNLIVDHGTFSLRVKTGNITNTNIIEKGIATILIEQQYKIAIKKYLSHVKFDLVMYSTPPVTLAKVVKYIKKRDNAKSYLLLKDIFPQNAIDIGMLSKTGIKGLMYYYFRQKEKNLYSLSDYIGCMSPANVEYLLKNNTTINPQNVEVCPNCIDVIDQKVGEKKKKEIRKKYDIPYDRKVFVYGGNLGRPQGITFVIDCLKSQKDNDKIYFLIVGDGTEYSKLEKYIRDSKQENVKLLKSIPKMDYDSMVGACDVGLIFLDYRFTIPNFPSRLLSYMQAQIPILAVTDVNTDVGKIIVDGKFGWWCRSNSISEFDNCISTILENDDDMSEDEWRFLNENYSSRNGYEIIMKHFS